MGFIKSDLYEKDSILRAVKQTEKEFAIWLKLAAFNYYVCGSKNKCSTTLFLLTLAVIYVGKGEELLLPEKEPRLDTINDMTCVFSMRKL